MGLFKRNPNFERDMRTQPAFKGSMGVTAEQLVPAVQNAAPELTGHYKRGIKAVDGMVVATDIDSHMVEYGSVNNPPFAPLRRGIRAAGLRLEERPK